MVASWVLCDKCSWELDSVTCANQQLWLSKVGRQLRFTNTQVYDAPCKVIEREDLIIFDYGVSDGKNQWGAREGLLACTAILRFGIGLQKVVRKILLFWRLAPTSADVASIVAQEYESKLWREWRLWKYMKKPVYGICAGCAWCDFEPNIKTRNSICAIHMVIDQSVHI